MKAEIREESINRYYARDYKPGLFIYKRPIRNSIGLIVVVERNVAHLSRTRRVQPAASLHEKFGRCDVAVEITPSSTFRRCFHSQV